MAFPTTTAGWIAYVRDWIGADEYSDAQIQQFLDLAHVRVNTDMMSYQMEKVYHHTTTIENAEQAISLTSTISDFNKIRLVSVRGYGSLDVASVNEFMNRVSEPYDSNVRGIYNIDAGNLYMWPWPSENIIVDIFYYEMVPALSASRNSNTFTRFHPDVLLYAACLEAAPYMVEDERVTIWESKYTVGLQLVNKSSDDIKLGSTPLKRNFSVYGKAPLRTTLYSGGGSVGVFKPVSTNNTPPVVSPDTADTNNTISCSTGIWTAGPESYEYQWLRNGVDIAGETASTYHAHAIDDGTSISCKVRAINEAGTSAYATSSNSCAITLAIDVDIGFYSEAYFPASYFSDRYFI